jgi:hypothetical protein
MSRCPVLLFAALALGGCFSPDLPATITCGLDGTCPPGLRCETSANVCVDPSQAGVAELHFETQPASVEAGADAPAVVVQLRDRAGQIVPVTGGTFAVELGANQAGVNMLGSAVRSAERGVVSFDALRFDHPARGLRVIVRGNDISATSEPFDVTTSRPAVADLSVGGVVDGCARVTYKLQQAQSLPVKLLVEFDPDGPGGPLPFRRATQAGSDPGKAGVDGVLGSPQATSRTFTWNTTADLPLVDTAGVLRITPQSGGLVGAPAEAPVTVRNGPRFYPFPLGVQNLGLIHFVDGNHDGLYFESSVNFATNAIDIDGMDSFPIPAGASVNDYAVGDLDGDGLLDLVVALSTGTLVAKHERSPAGHLGASAPVAAAFRQLVTADLDHDGLAEILGVDAASGDVVILHGSRAVPLAITEVSRPWRGGDTGHVRLADLDRDGWQDLVIGRASATAPVAVVRGGASGFAAPTVDSGLAGDVLAVADLDQDGRDDLASLDATGLHVAASTAGRIDIASIAGRVLATGDVDGDHLPDLVVATADHVFVYQHAPVRHTVAFRAAVNLGLATDTTSLLVDNLGNIDRMNIYAIHESGSTSSVIIFNNVSARRCDAHLEGPPLSPYDAYSPGILTEVNGDGKLDYVSIRGSFTQHGQLVASLGRGDGRFVPADEPLYEWPQGTIPRSLTSADFDGDGAADLAFASNSLSQVLVLYNDPAAPGTYSPLALPLAYPEGFAVADLDHDGAQDLAILDSGQLQIRRGDPRGKRAFGPAVILPAVLDSGGEQGHCFDNCRTRIADLDGDGALDILVATPAQIFVFLADAGAPGGFGAPLAMPLTTYAFSTIEDALGDRRAEIFAYVSAASGASPLLTAFDVRASRDGFEQVWQAPDDSVANPFTIDLDGDGTKETVVSHLDRYATLTRGPEPVLEPIVPALYSSFYAPFATADLDSDGHEDILAVRDGQLAVIRVGEDGPKDLGTLLTTRGQGDPGGYGNALSVGDFTGDGQADLAIRDAAAQALTLVRQSHDQPGTLDAAEVRLPGYYRSGLADLDGDRRDDLITYGARGGLYYPAPFAPGDDARCVADWNGFPFAVGDVDHDGRTDVVEASSTDVLFLASPADACPAPVSVMSLDRPGLPHWHPLALELGDLNQDGFLDVVVATDAIRVALQNPDAPGTFTVTDHETRIQADQRPYYDLELADLNHDRILDVVFIDDQDALRIFFGDGTGAFFQKTVVPDDRSPGWGASISVADVNDDGVLDIVVGRAFRNDVYLQAVDPDQPNVGKGELAYAYSTAGPNANVFDAEGTQLVDFDGDGLKDLLYVDPAQGTMLLRGR